MIAAIRHTPAITNATVLSEDAKAVDACSLSKAASGPDIWAVNAYAPAMESPAGPSTGMSRR